MQESIAFLLRVQCRRKESSRSLSHLLMSFLSSNANRRVPWPPGTYQEVNACSTSAIGIAGYANDIRMDCVCTYPSEDCKW